jgi:hypothetical protein
LPEKTKKESKATEKEIKTSSIAQKARRTITTTGSSPRENKTS